MSQPQLPLGFALASRVRTARELRGLTQRETVDLMDDPISTAALSQIESGKVRPTDQTARELARALEVPTEFFFAQWPEGSSEGRDPAVFFRDLRSTPARERKRALALARILNDLIAAIETYVRLPRLELPTLAEPFDGEPSEIEAAADAVRREWSLGLDPISHVTREIERHGIPVARLSLGHRHVDAFSVPYQRRPVILLADDKSSYARSRFDAAHELGHLVMHRDQTSPERSVETQAHRFASSFLMPWDPAREFLPATLDGSTWGRLAELKRHWGLSISGLLRRAHDVGLMSSSTYRNGMKYMSARGWRRNEPGDRELGPPEAPLLLERALRVIEVEHGLTPEELVASAHLPVDDVLELVEASNDARPIVEL